jgi:DNA-binding transcriptional MocR family regulator
LRALPRPVRLRGSICTCPPSVKRYEALAADLEATIRQGVLRAGERLPSVRSMSTSRGVSPSTVFQAYYLLESRGLVRARERSGYFVADGVRPALAAPQGLSQSRPTPVRPDVCELVFGILEASADRDDSGLGSAFPSPALFPFKQLGRSLAAAMRDFDPLGIHEGLPAGQPELLRHIAARYRVDGVPVDGGELIVTNGALEALNLCLAALTRPGDAVLVENPAFYCALQSIEQRGLKAVPVPTDPCEGIDLAALEQAIRRHRPRACWLMPTFQNPLGSLMPAPRKQQLVELLARHEIPLIEDDVCAELFFGERRPPPAKAYDKAGLVLHCGSFSKSLAPGWRVGWVAAGRFAPAVARHKLALNLATAAPVQLGLARFLEQGAYDRHLRRLRTVLQTQRDALTECMARHFPAGTCATRPEGGYVLWVELPRGTDTLALHEQALREGVCFAPGPMFSPERGFRRCLRLNFGQAWTPRSEQAVATLGRLLAQREKRAA